MTKKRTIKRQSANKYPPIHEEEVKKDNFGGFPLNPNNSDRISFNRELTKDKKISKISNVSYEIKIEEEWIWIVRYDDHGGKGSLHRHERIVLKNETNAVITDGVKRNGTKKKLYDWAITDIKKNYIRYRMRFLKRNGIDLY